LSHVLLGVTGSVAAVKTPELVAALRSAGQEVQVVATDPALSFFDRSALDSSGGARVYVDADEWPQGRLFRVGEPVLHIELRTWADLLVIAPLDANTLAKLAVGLCDNLLTCVYRAWDLGRPVLLAPAMNTLMWEHPATARHLRQLLEDHGGAAEPASGDAEAVCAAINEAGVRLRVVAPQSKRLACGDQGMGGMADVAAIARAVEEALAP
jgi:phosphopantothenoylcysteine decarboxylase